MDIKEIDAFEDKIIEVAESLMEYENMDKGAKFNVLEEYFVTSTSLLKVLLEIIRNHKITIKKTDEIIEKAYKKIEELTNKKVEMDLSLSTLAQLSVNEPDKLVEYFRNIEEMA